ncbi:MAG: energy transducer TonB, partial [Cyanobacteria bacterium J06635_13]
PVALEITQIEPITIVEPEPQSISHNASQPKSDLEPEAKTPTPTTAESAPEPNPEPPASISEKPNPVETPPVSEPEPEPDPPPLTSTASDAVTPSDTEPEIEKIIRANQAERQNSHREPPIIDPPEPTTEQLRSPQADNSERNLTEIQSEETADQSLDSAFPREDTETEAESNPRSNPVSDATSNDAGENSEVSEPKETDTAMNNIPQESAPLSITCEANCQPEYPDALDGVEGSAGIRLTINRDGEVIDAAIALSNGNPKLDEAALEAAQEMEFSQLNRDQAVVQINITFTVAN